MAPFKLVFFVSRTQLQVVVISSSPTHVPLLPKCRQGDKILKQQQLTLTVVVPRRTDKAGRQNGVAEQGVPWLRAWVREKKAPNHFSW